jgi:hypothetical protein
MRTAAASGITQRGLWLLFIDPPVTIIMIITKTLTTR